MSSSAGPSSDTDSGRVSLDNDTDVPISDVRILNLFLSIFQSFPLDHKALHMRQLPATFSIEASVIPFFYLIDFLLLIFSFKQTFIAYPLNLMGLLFFCFVGVRRASSSRR